MNKNNREASKRKKRIEQTILTLSISIAFIVIFGFAETSQMSLRLVKGKLSSAYHPKPFYSEGFNLFYVLHQSITPFLITLTSYEIVRPFTNWNKLFFIVWMIWYLCVILLSFLIFFFLTTPTNLWLIFFIIFFVYQIITFVWFIWLIRDKDDMRTFIFEDKADW